MRSLNFGTSRLVLLALLALGCASSDPGADEPVARTQGALKAGEACTSASQCEASAPFCVDGVCCTTSCASPCSACAATSKQSLSGSGTCGPALAGFDPHDDCATDPVASCGKTGACNGSGACAIYPQGTSCKTQAGQTNECVFQSSKGTICSGSGTGTCYTETSPSGVPCAPYVCKNGACAFPCAGDADCQPPNRCEGGVCKPKRANGAPCTTAAECDSGNCTDGVCCDSSCGGQCVACNLAGKVGTCSVVVGAPPVAPRPDCAGAAPCKGSCAGDPNKCNYPNDATKCGSAQCSGDVSTPAPACDGAGSCVPKTTDPCTPFGCDSATGACKATCGGNSDCAQGAVCDTSTNKCAVASATCKDTFTVALPNGQTQSCVPYKCVGGKCQQQCSASGDCAPGYGCVGPSCVAETDGGGGAAGSSAGGAAGSGGSGGGGGSAGASIGGTSTGGTSTGGAASGEGASEDEGGCGCRAPRKSPRHDGALLLALAGALALRRRELRARR